jgi:hypothetical protein
MGHCGRSRRSDVVLHSVNACTHASVQADHVSEGTAALSLRGPGAGPRRQQLVQGAGICAYAANGVHIAPLNCRYKTEYKKDFCMCTSPYRMKFDPPANSQLRFVCSLPAALLDPNYVSSTLQRICDQ